MSGFCKGVSLLQCVCEVVCLFSCIFFSFCQIFMEYRDWMQGQFFSSYLKWDLEKTGKQKSILRYSHGILEMNFKKKKRAYICISIYNFCEILLQQVTCGFKKKPKNKQTKKPPQKNRRLPDSMTEFSWILQMLSTWSASALMGRVELSLWVY